MSRFDKLLKEILSLSKGLRFDELRKVKEIVEAEIDDKK